MPSSGRKSVFVLRNWKLERVPSEFLLSANYSHFPVSEFPLLRLRTPYFHALHREGRHCACAQLELQLQRRDARLPQNTNKKVQQNQLKNKNCASFWFFTLPRRAVSAAAAIVVAVAAVVVARVAHSIRTYSDTLMCVGGAPVWVCDVNVSALCNMVAAVSNVVYFSIFCGFSRFYVAC